MYRILFTFSLSLFVFGCLVAGNEDERGYFLETDRSVYAFEDTMKVTFLNNTGNTLSGGVGWCGQHALQKMVDGEWQTVISPVLESNAIVACPEIAISLRPGQSYTYPAFPVEQWMGEGLFLLELEYRVERLPDRDEIITVQSEPFEVFRVLPGVKVNE